MGYVSHNKMPSNKSLQQRLEELGGIDINQKESLEEGLEKLEKKPKHLDESQVNELLKLYNQGKFSIKEIADRFGVPTSEIYSTLYDLQRRKAYVKKRFKRIAVLVGGAAIAISLLYTASINLPKLKNYFTQRRFNSYQQTFQQIETHIQSGDYKEADRVSEDLQARLNQEGNSFAQLRDKASKLDDEIIDPQIKRLEYIALFNGIKQDTEKQSYGDVSARIKSLASAVEKDKFPSDKELLNQIKDFTYTKLKFVPQNTEKKLAKEGYYEQIWVEPVYEHKASLASKAVSIPGFFADSLLMAVTNNKAGPIINEEAGKDSSGRTKLRARGEEVKVKDGYYKNGPWHPPVYEDIGVPAHYKQIQVNPYLGTEKEIGTVQIK